MGVPMSLEHPNNGHEALEAEEKNHSRETSCSSSGLGCGARSSTDGSNPPQPSPDTFSSIIAELLDLRKKEFNIFTEAHLDGYIEGLFKAQKLVEDAIERTWNNRRFVTGSIVSQEKKEKAYRDGWVNGFNALKRELGLNDGK